MYAHIVTYPVSTMTNTNLHTYHYESNRLLRGDSNDEDEYNVAFLARDVTDGLDEEWKRSMHWVGFLVVGAATRLPSPEGVGGGGASGVAT
jgi:hypothetical protein